MGPVLVEWRVSKWVVVVVLITMTNKSVRVCIVIVSIVFGVSINVIDDVIVVVIVVIIVNSFGVGSLIACNPIKNRIWLVFVRRGVTHFLVFVTV